MPEDAIFNFDMNPEVPDASKPLHVPPGDYFMVLQKGTKAHTSEKGNSVITARLGIGQPVDDEIERLDASIIGRPMFAGCTVNLPTGLSFFRALWEAIGLDWGGPMNSEEAIAAIDSRDGTQVIGKVADHEYQGVISSRVGLVKRVE